MFVHDISESLPGKKNLETGLEGKIAFWADLWGQVENQYAFGEGEPALVITIFTICFSAAHCCKNTRQTALNIGFLPHKYVNESIALTG